MAISRAAWLFGVARCESALQADRVGGGLGGVATIGEYADFHVAVWCLAQGAIWRGALSGVCVCGAAALELFCQLAQPGVNEPDWQCQFDHQGLFSAPDCAAFGRAFRFGGFCGVVPALGRADAGVSLAAELDDAVVAVLFAACHGDSVGLWAVVGGAECALSRCELSGAVPGAGVDVRNPGHLWQHAHPRALSLAFGAEPDDGRDGGLSLGLARQPPGRCSCSRWAVLCFDRH